MPIHKTPIIPVKASFAKVKGQAHEPNLKAICMFMATGFFWGTDTYWKDEIALAPASNNELDENRYFQKSTPWFHLNYQPRKISFNQALAEFTQLFEGIVKEQVQQEKVILPLSGGLDSRTQAVALAKMNAEVTSYSYAFKGGYKEHVIAEKIAKACHFQFHKYEIDKGYLWKLIEDLAVINGCHSEFTHPRQMAVLNELKNMQGVFSLGHWGDVLFDRGVPPGTPLEGLLELSLQKIIKKGGMELASALWEAWALEGSFKEYLHEQVAQALNKIQIKNASAKMRAFKSLYWAPRWTSTNLAVFAEAHPIYLPYYDDRMCEFICGIPEEYLADRKLQLAYIQQQNPALAAITWQDHKPFHLNNYQYNKFPYNFPYRVKSKLSRELQALYGKKYIQRNWELQFLGKENDQHLRKYLFSKELTAFIPNDLISAFYSKFTTTDQVYYSHPVSMLLTLGLWLKTSANAS